MTQNLLTLSSGFPLLYLLNIVSTDEDTNSEKLKNAIRRIFTSAFRHKNMVTISKGKINSDHIFDDE